MPLPPCDPCTCIPANIPNDKFKQDVVISLCNTLTALGYEFPEGDACNPCACIQANIPNDKFKQDVEILLCLIVANIGGGGGGGSVTNFSFTDANGISGVVTNPTTTPNLTLSIDNDAVSFAQIQNITTNRLLGRATAGAGDMEEIVLGTGLSFTGTTLNVSGSGIAITSLTGDVTGTGPGATATTIANDAVTFAKFQNITTARILGRFTAGSGDMEEIALGTGLSISGGTLNLTFGASSFLYTADPFLIASLTADGADTLGIDISGGGAASNTRGAYISLRGNEDASAGTALFSAGDVSGATAKLIAPNQTNGIASMEAGLAKITIDKDGAIQLVPRSGVSSYIYRSVNTQSLVISSWNGTSRATGAVMQLDTTAAGGNVYIDVCSGSSSAVLSLRNAGVGETDTTVLAIGFITSINDRFRWGVVGNGDLIYGTSANGLADNFIHPITSNGSDNRRLTIQGGGGSGLDLGRGAVVRVSGNENASTPGELLLSAGDVSSSATAYLDVGHASASIINRVASTQVRAVNATRETLTFDTISSVTENKKVQTTDNTTTTLWTFTLVDNTTYSFDALVTGRFSSTTAKGTSGRIFFGAYRNNGGGAVLNEAGGGVENVMVPYGASGYTVAIDVTGNTVRIRVTGATAETVNWGTTVRYMSST